MLGKSVVFLFGLAALYPMVSTCADDPKPGVANGALILQLPRSPAADEAVCVRISVGVLPRNTRIVVRLGNGEIVGTVAPYGVRPNQKAGVYTIRIPTNAAVNGKVSLRLEVEEKSAVTARAPTPAEVEDARLTFVPITGEEGKQR
jgi:hypothetical protein